MRFKGFEGHFWFFLILFLFSGFLLALGQFEWAGRVRGWIEKPFIFIENQIFQTYQSFRETTKGWHWRFSQSSCQEDIITLEGRLRQLAVDQNQLSSCLEESEQLKKLLGAPLPPQWKFIMARVIAGGEMMRVDKGWKEGVKEGMMVVSEEVLIGRVVVVKEENSLVQLLTTPGVKVPVVVKVPVARQARLPDGQAYKPGSGVVARGLLRGEGQGELVLERVLQEEDIQKGDLVVSLGEEGWLPDLVIGQIEEVETNPADIWKRAEVSLLVDYQGLKYVFLVID